MTWLLAACLFAAPVAPTPAAPQLHVAIIAVAADLNRIGSASSLAGGLATRLEADGLRVTRLGVAHPLPAEEAIAQARLAGVDFVVGVASTGSCPSLLIPPKVAEPTQSPGPIDTREIAAVVRQMAEAARYRESAAAAESLKGRIPWCERVPNELETFVLTAAPVPTIVVRGSAGNIDSIAGELSRVLRSAARSERP